MVIGKTIRADMLPKTKVKIVIDNEDAKEVTDIIITACTDTIGDGKIFISTIDAAIRTRNGEKGKDDV